MILTKLLKGLDYEVIQGKDSIEINEVNYDSRLVKNDSLFVCIKGFAVDGHKYAKAAIEKGATAIVCEDFIECDNSEVAIIKVKDPRKALAIIGDVYKRQTRSYASCNYDVYNGR